MNRTHSEAGRKPAKSAEKPKDKVELADEDSFPASDPPAFATPQPRETEPSPQQADTKTAGQQADWKQGQAAGAREAPKGAEERRRQYQAAKH